MFEIILNSLCFQQQKSSKIDEEVQQHWLAANDDDAMCIIELVVGNWDGHSLFWSLSVCVFMSFTRPHSPSLHNIAY